MDRIDDRSTPFLRPYDFLIADAQKISLEGKIILMTVIEKTPVIPDSIRDLFGFSVK